MLVAASAAAQTAPPGDYEQTVKPLLQRRCWSCHGALRQQGGLRLDTAAAAKAGGESGPAVVPGDSGASLLIQAITGSAGFQMPPESEGKPLGEAEVTQLRRWIDAGAISPVDQAPQADPRDHWSFRKPVRPAVPVIDAAHAVPDGNVIDAFLQQQRLQHGVTPAGPAPRHVLVRRLYLDLIGLPPSGAELSATLADDAPDAYAKLVDRLLASPQYGERFGRHWMDVWRYSDWYGRRSVPDVMNSYAQIWRWRDWIVRSLNSDLGYDEMVRLMLAADELAPADLEALPATGFVVRNWFKWNYNQWKRDLVEHTSKAFLGLTMNCAHCHDHKYDPLSQEDYFRLRACFEPLELRHDRVPGEPDPGPFRKYVYTESYGPIASGMVRVFDEQLAAPTHIYSGGDERNVVPGKPPATPAPPEILGGRFQATPVTLPKPAWYPGLQEFVQREERQAAAQQLGKQQAALTAARTALAAAEAAVAQSQADQAGAAPQGQATPVEAARQALRLAEANEVTARLRADALEARIAADQLRYGDEPSSDEAARRARAASQAGRLAALAAARQALVEAEQPLAAAKAPPPGQEAAKPDAIAKLEVAVQAAQAAVEKSWQALAVESESYTPLSPQYPTTSSGRRRALAEWITARDNPLAARVAVNHVWAWHFGQPLVETVFNFGRSGKAPSHPELLDWLAVELMDHGWEWKQLHRLMVTSRAYQMAGDDDATESNRARDPNNRWLWRFSPRRMEAELVRDSVLAATDGLNPILGGPEIDHAQGLAVARRSLYFAQHGEGQMQFLELFDGANVCDAYRRTESVMPQQALALANSPLSLEHGRRWARQQWCETGAATTTTDQRDDAFIAAAFWQLLSRQPSQQETALSRQFLVQQRQLFAAEPTGLAAGRPAADSRAEDDVAWPSLDPDTRAAENLVHALLNHHDFVTIH